MDPRNCQDAIKVLPSFARGGLSLRCADKSANLGFVHLLLPKNCATIWAREEQKGYDKIAEAELQIEDIRKRIQTIRSEQISGENVYQLLLAFDELYDEMDEPGKKELLRAIIERIDLFPEKREDGCWIRNIVFTFPVPIQGHEVKELPLEKSTLIDCIVLLLKKYDRQNGICRDN